MKMEVGGTTSASALSLGFWPCTDAAAAPHSRISALLRCISVTLQNIKPNSASLSPFLSINSSLNPSCISSIHLRNASRPHRSHRPRRLRRPPPNARLPHRLQDLNPLPQTSRPSRRPTQSTRYNTQEFCRVSAAAPRAIEGCRRCSLGTRDFLYTSIEAVCSSLSLWDCIPIC
jgi:hypothetical protein